jgi:hypothetical protein
VTIKNNKDIRIKKKILKKLGKKLKLIEEVIKKGLEEKGEKTKIYFN